MATTGGTTGPGSGSLDLLDRAETLVNDYKRRDAAWNAAGGYIKRLEAKEPRHAALAEAAERKYKDVAAMSGGAESLLKITDKLDSLDDELAAAGRNFDVAKKAAAARADIPDAVIDGVHPLVQTKARAAKAHLVAGDHDAAKTALSPFTILEYLFTTNGHRRAHNKDRERLKGFVDGAKQVAKQNDGLVDAAEKKIADTQDKMGKTIRKALDDDGFKKIIADPGVASALAADETYRFLIDCQARNLDAKAIAAEIKSKMAADPNFRLEFSELNKQATGIVSSNASALNAARDESKLAKARHDAVKELIESGKAAAKGDTTSPHYRPDSKVADELLNEKMKVQSLAGQIAIRKAAKEDSSDLERELDTAARDLERHVVEFESRRDGWGQNRIEACIDAIEKGGDTFDPQALGDLSLSGVTNTWRIGRGADSAAVRMGDAFRGASRGLAGDARSLAGATRSGLSAAWDGAKAGGDKIWSGSRWAMDQGRQGLQYVKDTVGPWWGGPDFAKGGSSPSVPPPTGGSSGPT